MLVYELYKFVLANNSLQISWFKIVLTISRFRFGNITVKGFFIFIKILAHTLPSFTDMKKIFCLSTCSTCDRILKEIDARNLGFELQDIKTDKITPEQIDSMKKMAGSYEALFSRKALKYRELKLRDQNLREKDYRQLILEEYRFLKRPVVVLNQKIYVGSEKKTVETLKKILHP